MMGQTNFHCLLFLGQLLLPLLHALPVSSPEIANKSAKSPNSILAQQQQQQLKSMPNGQETQLNSLSAFASSYDSLGGTSQTGGAQPPVETGFKPSYKMPEMETNFTPMQSGGIVAGDSSNPPMANLPSTPMLMQYLPAQTLQDGSGTVQYLQLIPTRPIIVPISPYLTAASTSNVPASVPSLTPNIVAATPPDYGVPRNAGIQLSALPANTGVTGLHYSAAGLQGYASSISPVAAYRSSYRINREAKDKNFPPTFSLNLNEYLPPAAAGHDVSVSGTSTHPHTQVYIRARP